MRVRVLYQEASERTEKFLVRGLHEPGLSPQEYNVNLCCYWQQVFGSREDPQAMPMLAKPVELIWPEAQAA